MTGYETFALFNSLKLHFNRESYDYFKYNGKSNISVDAFENRRDKYHFHKLSVQGKVPVSSSTIGKLASKYILQESTLVSFVI